MIEGLGRVLFCHATSRNDEELFTPITPEERISIIFSGVEQEIVVCGHTHIQFEQQVGNLRILNAGSVGIPFADRPGAYWLLLSPQGHEFRRTVYDGEVATQEIWASRHPQAQEFAEENVLKVRTAAGDDGNVRAHRKGALVAGKMREQERKGAKKTPMSNISHKAIRTQPHRSAACCGTCQVQPEMGSIAM
jgi:hypothetical protein